MGSTLYSLFLLTLSLFTLSNPLCHDNESSSLLHFKESLTINKLASSAPLAYPKTRSWPRKANDCCSWDGVRCHQDSGHVISLDLSSSFLHGHINNNSTLFQLVHLESLNLADNYFRNSPIPPLIKRLVNLEYLNLSSAHFSGQIPFEISLLSRLSSLDLSLNVDEDSESRLLDLRSTGFDVLIRNMSSLKQLHLSYVRISSQVPDSLASFSSLESLVLTNCGLRGQFPINIFRLPRLRILNLHSNQDLEGHFPSFEHSPLEILSLARTSFSGELPSSIQNLHSLKTFDANSCNFSGVIPSSIGKLNLLNYLDLFGNNFRGNIPSSLSNLTQLEYISLSKNQFNSGNLSWVVTLTNLKLLSVWASNLTSSLPPSFAKLVHLETIKLSENNMSGEVDFDVFLSLKNLTELRLWKSGISLIINPIANRTTFPQFTVLTLSFCNITKFPEFIKHQKRLETLYLDHNRIGGQVPKWIWNVSTETLESLNLRGNFITGFQNTPSVLPWTRLELLLIASNSIKGALPLPRPSIVMYDAADNEFTGEVSSSFCDLVTVSFIDWSGNRLSGDLPRCFGNFSFTISFLNLERNLFSGTIPDTFTKESQLMAIDLSHNRFRGRLPRSLAECEMLEYLSLENNEIEDDFPHWLGNLPELRILVLRSNRFHGKIATKPPLESSLFFRELRIIDLSFNGFNGFLPSDYFRRWRAMAAKSAQGRKAEYLNESRISSNWLIGYPFTVTIAIKGVNRYYAAINEDLSIVDLSNNEFVGEIPDEIQRLNGIRSLDLSNNGLSGGIPSSLERLTNLESLDLSGNEISGKIPQELTKLNFLQYFNVSYNRLTGEIPQAKQFATFERSSYEGNLGLCGVPLPKKCGDSSSGLEEEEEEEEEESSESVFEFGWEIVAIGYGCGFVVGFFGGKAIVAKRKRWFVMAFRVRNF